MKNLLLHAAISSLVLAVCPGVRAQVNSGSNGSDGAFNPPTNTVINMADHTNGIYQYTSVNIPSGVTVTFIPNANNSPVVWLIQSSCVINGLVSVAGSDGGDVGTVGLAGPGGFRGGAGNAENLPPGDGYGPGGGKGAVLAGGNASFGTKGEATTNYAQGYSGDTYGTSFLLPLMGGSGGGGGGSRGGGGGGGAIMIVANSSIRIDGTIYAKGGRGINSGGGSGGGVRLVSPQVSGGGQINTLGGITCYSSCQFINNAGLGRIRFDSFDIQYSGALQGAFTQGFQPIIIPAAGQGIQLSVMSVGGVAVSANPSGVLLTPDAIVSGQQQNPISIVVHCTNLPLNTPITVTVRPANSASVSALGYNTTGTLTSSTVTVSLNMPRGGGIIYATAATGN